VNTAGTTYFQFSLWDSPILRLRWLYNIYPLSILFMRFPTIFLYWCNTCLMSFNSLYEIHCCCAEQHHCYYDHNFQFSLWDSTNAYLYVRTEATQALLSILFMRFLMIALGSLLWSKVLTFNSLYEIRAYKTAHHLTDKDVAFNSLYEILEILPEGNDRAFIFIFQFSLWDSAEVTEALELRPANTFNSLYEIHEMWRLYCQTPIVDSLSILFMRFIEAYAQSTKNTYYFLSILFMRFLWLCLRILPCWCLFQFSLWDSWKSLSSALAINSSTFNSLYEILFH